MFGLLKTAPAKSASSADAVVDAQASVNRLASALETAEQENVAARVAYDREMRDFVAGGTTTEPSLEPQRIAAGRSESLRRLVSEARDRLARLTIEAEEAERLDAIRSSGGLVADLISTAEARLAEFESAVAAARGAEAKLFDTLFDPRSGLRQRLGIAEAQRDADFARRRLCGRLIKIAQQGNCLVDAGFEIDGEVSAGPLERIFYARKR